MLGTFGYAVWQARDGKPAEAEKKTAVFNQEETDGIGKCRLTIDFGAGEMIVAAGAEGLAAGRLEYFQAEPDWRYSAADGRGELRIIRSEEPWEGWLSGPGSRGYRWDIKLNEAKTWEIETDAGACRMAMDLTEIPVERIDLDTGASSVDISFGDKQAHCRVEVDAGASDINLVFPAGAGVRIDYAGTLSGNNLAAAGLERQGDAYVTAGYDGAAVKFEAVVDMGAGSLEVEFR